MPFLPVTASKFGFLLDNKNSGQGRCFFQGGSVSLIKRRSWLYQSHSQIQHQGHLGEEEAGADKYKRKAGADQVHQALPDACRHNEACHRVDGLALTRGRGNQYQGGKQGQVFQAIQVGSLGAVSTSGSR